MLKKKSVIQSRQVCAARALLAWSQEDLAAAAKVSVATIRKLEQGSISPRADTMRDIQDAFEASGLEFIEPGGVRFLPDDVMAYQGDNGLTAFLDDVYQTVKRKPGEIVSVCSTESIIFPARAAHTSRHLERMNELKGKVTARCILLEINDTSIGNHYAEYRQITPMCREAVPFCVYGDKCALVILDSGQTSKIFVVQSTFMAQRFRKQFQSMWDKSMPLPYRRERDIQIFSSEFVETESDDTAKNKPERKIGSRR